MARIVVINHQAANIHSVAKALERVGARPVVTADPRELARADGAVLPGVGASDAALRTLGQLGLIEPIRDFGRSGRPLLCVCLGMQLLFPRSDEGELDGLGLIGGAVQRLPTSMTANGGGTLKVPHMGWNEVAFAESGARRHPIFRDLPDRSHFYFVHSYHCVPSEEGLIAATTNYGTEIAAALVKGQVVGTQFHPEKSGDGGLRIYENFVSHVNGRAS